MDRKKIIIICISGNLFSDQRMQRIASALTGAGWMVKLYFRPHSKYKKTHTETEDYGFENHAVKIPVASGILFYFLFNCSLFFRLLFKKTDHYYAVDSDTLPALTCLSYLKGKKLIFDSHEYFTEVPELAGKKFRKLIWQLITRAGVKRASLCLSVGDMLCLELENVYRKKFHSIRNVPVPETSLPQNPQDKFILYQGALNKGRMLEMFIDTAMRIPSLKFVLAGEGDLSAELRKRAEGATNIEFTGMLNPAGLRELTSRAFAGYNLLDAGNSLSYYYSLSNKYFDYMHAGIPSVSSRLPEYMLLNEKWECGVCIDNDENELFNLLQLWLRDTDLYAKLKENAKFASLNNHWNGEKIKLIKLLES